MKDNNHDEYNISFKEKLVKLLSHWIQHNKEHAESYQRWSNEAKDAEYNDVALLIEEAVKLTHESNRKFKEALKLTKKFRKKVI